MKYCINCGVELKKVSIYCTKCGFKLDRNISKKEIYHSKYKNDNAYFDLSRVSEKIKNNFSKEIFIGFLVIVVSSVAIYAVFGKMNITKSDSLSCNQENTQPLIEKVMKKEKSYYISNVCYNHRGEWHVFNEADSQVALADSSGGYEAVCGGIWKPVQTFSDMQSSISSYLVKSDIDSEDGLSKNCKISVGMKRYSQEKNFESIDVYDLNLTIYPENSNGDTQFEYLLY
jgi:hypothetical protein